MVHTNLYSILDFLRAMSMKLSIKDEKVSNKIVEEVYIADETAGFCLYFVESTDHKTLATINPKKTVFIQYFLYRKLRYLFLNLRHNHFHLIVLHLL